MTTRAPVVEQTVDLEQRFALLAERWWMEAGGRSISTQMTDSEAFRAIVALGEPAVPLILRELEHSHLHWHLALEEITGQNPAAAAQPGKVDEIRTAWLDWGHRRYPQR